MLRKAVLIVVMTWTLALPRIAEADSGLECWNRYEIRGILCSRMSFKVGPEFRYESGFSSLYYRHMDLGVSYRLGSQFVLSPCFRYVEQKSSGTWKHEKRPYIDATVEWRILPVATLSDRNRLEYRIHSEEETFRYRNKLTLTFCANTPLAMRPYIAEQVYYDLSKNVRNKNRVHAGVVIKPFECVTLDISYLWEARKGESSWSYVNVFFAAIRCDMGVRRRNGGSQP
jgi:hypothetical protein